MKQAPLALVLLVACHTQPTEPPFVIVDASRPDGGDLYDSACARLAELGCREALVACHDTLKHAQESGLTDLAPACVASAGTVGTLRACSPAWRRGCP